MAKKIRPKHVIADPYTNAVILEYLVESLSGNDSEMKQFKIHTPELNEDTDIVNVAYKITKQCKYIPEKWLNKVVDVLKEIQFRTMHHTINVNDSDLSSDARISNRLEANLELLYGSDEDRVSSLEDTLTICMDVQNIELVVYDDPLMSALSRLLSDHVENAAKTTFNLLKIFLLLADYDDFHESLSKHRIGLSIISIIDLELKRAEHLRAETAQNLNVEEGCQSESNRVDNILLLCCEILLRLSDNCSTLVKMLKKNLAGMLLFALPHCCKCQWLLSLLKLLTRATEYAEVVAEIESSQAFLSPIIFLVRLISSSDDEIVEYSMKVLHNLSFNYNALSQMIQADIIHKLITYPKHQRKAFGILYHGSTFVDLLPSSKLLGPLTKLSVDIFQSFTKNAIPKAYFAFLINVSPYGTVSFMI